MRGLNFFGECDALNGLSRTDDSDSGRRIRRGGRCGGGGRGGRKVGNKVIIIGGNMVECVNDGISADED